MYRVEHITANLGPYRLYHRNDLRTRELCDAHNYSEQHPGLYTDFEHYNNYNKLYGYHFGFESVESLNRWFAGFQEKLAKKGFVIKVFRVKYTDIAHGRSGRQIMFPKQLFPVHVLKLNDNHTRIY